MPQAIVIFRNLFVRIVGVALSVLSAAGCYDGRFGTPPEKSACEAPTETIASLRDSYAGTAYTVTSPVVVTGTVTSCDRASNFYRTFCIEENGAALEIVAGIDQLHNDFPVGSRVALRLEGLTVGESFGVLQVGRAPVPGSGYEVDYLGSRAALGRAVSRCGEQTEPIAPACLTIPELTPRRGGTLVRIDALRYTPEDLTTTSWAGYKRFTDADGNTIYTYVRSYADFAGPEVPAGWLSLTGILQYDDAGDGRYMLKLRDEEDCVQ